MSYKQLFNKHLVHGFCSLNVNVAVIGGQFILTTVTSRIRVVALKVVRQDLKRMGKCSLVCRELLSSYFQIFRPPNNANVE